MPRMTPRQIERMNNATQAYLEVEKDFQSEMGAASHIPYQWHWMEEDGPKWKKKEKITLRLDEETVKFFKGLGPGYQKRLNMVLRYYVEMRMAKFIEGRNAGIYFFDDHLEHHQDRALREDTERSARKRE